MSSDVRVRVPLPPPKQKECKVEPKYPRVKVQLTGEDGNAFFIIGKVSRALRRAGASDEDVKAFNREATSGDYNNLLKTCMEWVDVT